MYLQTACISKFLCKFKERAYMCVCKHRHVYMYMYTHTHTHAYLYFGMCMSVCVHTHTLHILHIEKLVKCI